MKLVEFSAKRVTEGTKIAEIVKQNFGSGEGKNAES